MCRCLVFKIEPCGTFHCTVQGGYDTKKILKCINVQNFPAALYTVVDQTTVNIT